MPFMMHRQPLMVGAGAAPALSQLFCHIPRLPAKDSP